jgi:Flp pilus assembly protein TadD
MAIRFCPQCGVQSLAGARFCHACGAALDGDARRSAPVGRRIPTLGAVVLGFFLVAGLGIWTAILSPASPRPGPGAGGGGGPRPPGPQVAGGAATNLPPDHPRVPMELPKDVKDFIADLAAKAKAAPEDVDAWLKLGRVDFRAAQIDRAYSDDALAAYRHVLERDSNNVEALRGVANVHYDRDEYKEAIPFYERFLALQPDDAGARTDLGTMYLYAGDPARAVATYKDVIHRNPSFLQAHYNLAVTYHQQGDSTAARAELESARKLATDDEVRKQIDDMLAALSGTPPPPAAGDGRPAPALSAFQSSVEQALRGHPILGPRIVGIEWSAPGAGRVLVQDFPMDGMPPAVREKFLAHVADQLKSAAGATPVEGPIKLDIADAASGSVMATVTP